MCCSIVLQRLKVCAIACLQPIRLLCEVALHVTFTAYSVEEQGQKAVFEPRRLGFEPESGHVEFVLASLLRVLGFRCQFLIQKLLQIRHHTSPGDGTLGQTVANVLNALSLTPTQEAVKKDILYLVEISPTSD
jgi:hypothetical protein